MPCTSSQGVQLPVNNFQNKLPYGSISRLSRQIGLSERTIREYFSGCDKQPRYRTVALLLLGQGFGLEEIQQQMISQYPMASCICDNPAENGKSHFPAIPAYDPLRVSLPPFVLDKLSICMNTLIDNAVKETNQRRTEIISEIADLAGCSQSSVKKMLAGYCDSDAKTRNRFEASWVMIVASAKVCGCSRSDANYLLSVAYPDIAMAFWLHPSYSAQEGYSTAAAKIEKHMQRMRSACRQDKGLHNCTQCRHCSLPKIELVVRSVKD